MGEGTLGRGFPLPWSPPTSDVVETPIRGELIGKLIVESFLPTVFPWFAAIDLTLMSEGLSLSGDLGGITGGVREVGELGIEWNVV